MSDATLLTLQAELTGSDREARRRLRLPDRLTLEHLHLALQAALGWEPGGEYEFEVLGQPYRGADGDELQPGSRGSRHPSRYSLSDFGPRADESYRYRYDDGDERALRLTVEEVDRTEKPGSAGPVVECLEAEGPHPAGAGAGAGPTSPEEVNGALFSRLGSVVPGGPAAPEATPAPSRREAGAPGGPGEGTGPDGLQPGDAVETELEPEAREALEAVFERFDAATRGARALPPPVRSAAEEMLIIQAEFDPEPLCGARKPETWAAGAIHGAHMVLRRRRGSPELTLRRLAERFGVSPGSVSRRSTRIRETASEHGFWPGPFGERFRARLAAERAGGRLEPDEGAQAREDPPPAVPGAPDAGDGEGAAAGDPVWRAEHLYLIGEQTGLRAPYEEAADHLEEHAEEIDRDDLKYLLQRGLEHAAGGPERRLLELAVRHFGTEVATWAPEGAERWL